MFTKCSINTIIRHFAKSAYKPVTHVIFDMDGTLLDTERIYTEIMQKLVEPFGKKFTFENKLCVMGAQAKPMSEYMVRAFDLPWTPEEYLQKQGELVMQRIQNVPLMPGVQKLVCHLKENNVLMAVATSSTKEAYDVKSKAHKELWAMFHHCVVGSADPDVKNGKPAPDIFLVAASRFPDKPKPESILVIEDAPNGIKAAVAAGMQVVMTPMPELPCEHSKEATLRLTSLEEFVPEDFGLPPYGSPAKK